MSCNLINSPAVDSLCHLLIIMQTLMSLIKLVTRDALKGHTVSKNGSISFFTRDALKGHTVSKNGLISFFFFLFFFSSS